MVPSTGRQLARGFLFCALLVIALCAPARSADSLDIYGTLQHFTWREFDDDGSQLLRESGPLFGVGVLYRVRDEGSRLRPSFKGDLFGGQVDYVGQACNLFGTCVPSSTDITYFGFQGQGDLGWGIPADRSAEVIPFGGIGIRWWVRDIGDSMTALGPAKGYEEYWTSYYLRMGIRAEINLEPANKAEAGAMKAEAKPAMLFAEIAARLPVYNENNVPDLDITLNPRMDPSVCAEIGVRGERLRFHAFYEGLRFKKSSEEIKGSVRYWQPASKADIYGLSVGAAF